MVQSSTMDAQKILGKRLFDLSLSIVALLLLSPLFLLITVAIMISSKGEVIYTQTRLGLGGKPFKCLKFRTMISDADTHLKELLQDDPALEAEWRQHQKLKTDPRVFPVGKFLRQASLDELPQLWNVLKGELSIVGPRPYMFNQRNELGSNAHKILSIKPGITGLWQTSGRSQMTFRQRIELDAKYVEENSFFSDLSLILKTFPALFRDAY